MIRRIERKKALRMSRSSKNRTGILDANIFVLRRMAHQESLLHLRQVIQEMLSREVVDELPGDGEGAARQCNFRGSLRNDVRQVGRESMGDMSSGGWRANGNHCSCVRHIRCRREYRRPAQTVAEQQGWGAMVLTQIICGRHKIADVG